MKPLRSFRVRLVLWTVVMEALLLVALALALMLILRAIQQNRVTEILELAASQVNAAVDVQDGAFVIPPRDTAELQADGIMVWILRVDGQVGATIGAAERYPLPTELPSTLQMNEIKLPDDKPYRLYRVPLQEGQRILGSVILAYPLHESQVLQERFLTGLLVLIPTILALSALGGLMLANRALAPIKQITYTARQISAEDLSRRLNLNLPDDEIGQLAHTFDEMLERLEQSFRREQQLTADVSHELRTPLGMLKAQLSLARSRPRSKDELLKMMAAMEEDVDRLAEIMERTLLLARVEQQGVISKEPIFLDDLLITLFERFLAEAQAKGVNLDFEFAEQIDWRLMGNGPYLEQVFTNLLQNALDHTPAGGQVTISAERDWQNFRIAIHDTGLGIPAEHIPHIFERYYRVDDARTRATGGLGLGLAIAQTIVQAHGGKISVESAPNAGSIFTVILPCGLEKKRRMV